MERVLIVGQDTALNEALCAVLEDVGYGVAVCSGTTLALALLRISHQPFVVLLADDESHEQSPDGTAQAWTHILGAARSLPRHAYILLSNQPPRALEQWNPHTQAFVPVVPLPFDTKLLLTRVGEAVRRLRFVAASNRPSYSLTPGRPPYDDDTTSEHDLVCDVTVEPGAVIGDEPAREVHDDCARTPKEVELARAGLIAARAVVARARQAQARAWEALTQARAREPQARAWEVLARAREALYRAHAAQEALAQVRDMRNPAPCRDNQQCGLVAAGCGRPVAAGCAACSLRG